MSHLIELLERAGRDARFAVDAVALEAGGGNRPDAVTSWAAGRAGSRILMMGYVSAPDHEPRPEDAPAEAPEEPEQQEPDAA